MNNFQGRREELFKNNPKYKKFFNFIKKSDAKLTAEQRAKLEFERTYLHTLINKYINILNSIPQEGRFSIEGYM